MIVDAGGQGGGQAIEFQHVHPRQAFLHQFHAVPVAPEHAGGGHAGILEQPSQAPQLGIESLGRTPRQMLAPQAVDQLFDRQGTAGRQQQAAQDLLGLGPAAGQAAPATAEVDLPEQSDFQCARHGGSPGF